jgi:hypothetical protein
MAVSRARAIAIGANFISSANFAAQTRECESLLADLQWDRFDNLYAQLADFADRENDGMEFDEPWKQFQNSLIAWLKRRLETVANFNDFLCALARLSTVLSSPEALWSVLHSEITPRLKVTLNQSKIIAVAHFTANQLFEFGFPGFCHSSACDTGNINNEESIIDIFYSIVGFVHACEIPPIYTIKLPFYYEFLRELLALFLQIRDFDPHRFVWLIEMIQLHLHVESEAFLRIVEEVIKYFVESSNEPDHLRKLWRLCTLSTAPLLCHTQQLHGWIDDCYQSVVQAQRDFSDRFIFSGLIYCDWELPDNRLTDAFEAWRLYITNFARKFTELPELPAGLVETALMD